MTRHRSPIGSALTYSWRHTSGFSRRQWARFEGWLAVVSALIVYVVAFRYLDFVHVSDAHGWIYLVTTYAGHFALFAVLAWLMLLPLAVIVPSRLVILPVSALVLLAALTLLAIDTTVYAQYRFHVSAFVWELLTGPASEEIFSLSTYTRFVIALTVLEIAIAAIVGLSVAAWCVTSEGLRGKGKYVFGVWLTALLVSQLMHIWYEAHYDSEITAITRHFPAYSPLTGKRLLARTGWLDPEETRRRNVLEEPSSRADLNYPVRPLDCRDDGRTMNLFVVIVDALRADSFDARVMPTLFALTRHPNAQHFTEHVSGGNATKPGIFSLFYGLPANYWSAFAAARLAPELIRRHQMAGYRIGAFSSATLLSPAFDRTVFASVPDLSLGADGDDPLERDARAISELERFVRDADASGPWLGVLFLDAAHSAAVPDGWTPFRPQWESVDHVKLDADFDPLPYLNRYRNALNWIDAQLGALIERMTRRGELDDTIVLLTSDHGEEFNDLGQNYWGHGSNFARHQTMVPLLIVWPGRPRASFSHRTSHFDVAPTLLTEALGCVNPPSDHSIGTSLFDERRRRTWLPVHSYFNYALVSRDRLLVTYPHGGYEILDRDNRRLDDEVLAPGKLAAAMEAMTRFYR